MRRYSFAYAIFLATVVILMSNCKTVTTKNEMQTKENIAVISSMHDIELVANLADLVVFDIDHTVLEAKTIYCHSNWFYDQYEDARKNGISEEAAFAAIVSPWEKSQKNCVVKPVEPMTPAFIKALQTRGKKVMALTTRSKNIADDTINQLKSLDVDFSITAPNPQTDSFLDGVYSKNGVVFTTEYRSKGDVLKEYLARASMKPAHIVFVDDSYRNLVSVADVLGREGIMVQAYHYPLVKRSLPSWDKEMAARIWEEESRRE